MGIESYHSPPGLQPECQTLPRLQWKSSSPLDSSGNTRGRVKYRSFLKVRRVLEIQHGVVLVEVLGCGVMLGRALEILGIWHRVMLGAALECNSKFPW